MPYEEIRCKTCGEIASKEDINCGFCGDSLKPISTSLSNNETEPSTLISSKLVKWKSLKPGYKKLAFYIAVTVADLITSLIVMVSAGLPLDAYWFLFLGLYLLILIIGSIIKGAISESDFKDHLAQGIALMIFVGFIIVIIVIPIYLITVFQWILGTISISISLPSWLQAILDQIGYAISQVIGQIMLGILGFVWDIIKSMFSPVIESIQQSLGENSIPGYEPFLLISLLVVTSILIVYKYHLKIERRL